MKIFSIVDIRLPFMKSVSSSFALFHSPQKTKRMIKK
jgi:hypothetical protein